MAQPNPEYQYNPLDLDQDVAVGINLPFSGRDGSPFDQNYTTEQQALANLRTLFLTRKGERYMQPLFGTDLYETLFEINTPDLGDTMERIIRSDIGYWCPYIIIDDIIIEQALDSEPGPIGHGYKITLKFTVDKFIFGRTITLLIAPSGRAEIEG